MPNKIYKNKSYSKVQPYNIEIPTWWIFHATYDSALLYVNMYSDIDGAYYAPYAPYVVYSSSGFVMSEPDPMYSPTTSEYDIGIEFDGEFKVSATTTIYDNELDMDFHHSGAGNIFSVDYNYSCSGFPCTYMNVLSYQINLLRRRSRGTIDYA